MLVNKSWPLLGAGCLCKFTLDYKNHEGKDHGYLNQHCIPSSQQSTMLLASNMYPIKIIEFMDGFIPQIDTHS